VATSFFAFIWAFHIKHPAFNPVIDGLAFCLSGIYSLIAAKKAVNQARAIKPVTLLTRANTVDLPAAASLVRASEIPAQEQAAILLRAATNVKDTAPEEMVRASIGPQDK
jgi:hypothetical protein